MMIKLSVKNIAIFLMVTGVLHAQDFVKWTDPLTISEIYRDSWLPQVAIDKQDNILCVWRLLNGNSQRTAALRYDASQGQWQTNATYVSKSVSSQGAYEQQLTMDGAGNAWAIWRLMSGIEKVIQVSRFEPSVGWFSIAQAMTLSDTTKDAYYPIVSSNTQGTTLACWTWDTQVQAALYDVWSTPTTLSEQGAAQTSGVIDDRGYATVTWQRFDVDHYQIEVATYAHGIWSPAVVLSDSTHNAYNPQVAVNGQGDAIVVWFEDDNGILRVYGSKRAVGADWQDSQLISAADAQLARFPQVVMNHDGNIIIMWEQYDGQNWRIATCAGLFSRSTWSTTTFVSAAGHDAFDPDIAIDQYGSALATWMFYDSQTIKRIQVARCDAKSKTWTSVSEQPLLSGASSDSQSPQIAYNSNSGQIVVAWQTFAGFNWSIQVVQGILQRPVIISARRECHRFPRRSYIADCITWKATNGAVAYAIFGDDNKTLLATIPATCPLKFCNAHTTVSASHTYYMYAVNAAGVYSNSAVVMIK